MSQVQKPANNRYLSTLFNDLINIPMEQSYYQAQEEQNCRTIGNRIPARLTHSQYKQKTNSNNSTNKIPTPIQFQDILALADCQTYKIDSLNKEINGIKNNYSRWCKFTQQRQLQLKNERTSSSTLINAAKCIYNDDINTKLIKQKDRIINGLQKQLKNLLTQQSINNNTNNINEKLRRQNYQLKQQVKNLEQQRKKLQQQISNYEQQISNYEQQIDQLIEDNKYKQAKTMLLTQRIQDFSNKLSNLPQSTQIMQYQQTINQLSQQIHQLKNVNQHISNQYNQLSISNNDILSINQQLKQQLITKDNQINSLKKNMTNTIKQYSHIVHTNQQQIKTILIKCQQLHKKTIELEDKCKCYQQSAQKSITDNSQMVSEYQLCIKDIWSFIAKIHSDQISKYNVYQAINNMLFEKFNQIIKLSLENSFRQIQDQATKQLECFNKAQIRKINRMYLTIIMQKLSAQIDGLKNKANNLVCVQI